VTTTEVHDAVVVGAGFAGLHLLHSFRERGLRVMGVEAGEGVGGTWYWNRYPGARCDVESLDYSFGFHPDLEQEWSWSERYATGPEIHRYAEFVADRLDLRDLIRFRTRVEAAVFDDATGLWAVSLDDGTTAYARDCVMATGCLSTAKLPEIDGIETFAGEIHHPGRWPTDEPDLRGKRIAVLGTGSSGIQLVSALAPVAGQLYVLQRTPNYSMPAQNRPLTEDELAEAKRTYPERRRIARRTKRGFPLPGTVTGRPASSFTRQEQRDRLEAAWQHGGAIFTSVFDDVTTDEESNLVVAEFVRGKIREIVNDPAVAERLTPRDHPLGGKRPCVDTGYYETFNRTNVELVDIRATPIERITTDSIVVGERELGIDVLIVATGYDAITGTLNAVDIRGRGGVRLKDDWRDGATAYLGLMPAGFPNLFVITGPGSPSVLSNMFVSIEQHVELLFRLLDERSRRGLPLIEAERGAQERWAERVAQIADSTLLVSANSWYLGANVPGKPRQFMPYAGGMDSFIRDCEDILDRGFDGFRFSTPADVVATTPPYALSSHT
jgi:cyclohexanone monooxygenase